MGSMDSGFADVEDCGEVQLYDAAPLQPADPQLSWNGTLSVLKSFGLPSGECVLSVPAEWSTFVIEQEQAAALPCALGNYPQMVRDLRAIIQAKSMSSLRNGSARVIALTGLARQTSELGRRREFTALLVATGMLRVAQQFDDAGRLLKTHANDFSENLKPIVANELAALAWQRGETQAAARMWETQKPSPAVWFNRGMAALFQDQPEAALAPLKKAVEHLPEEHGWQYLARLYLALAELRK